MRSFQDVHPPHAGPQRHNVLLARPCTLNKPSRSSPHPGKTIPALEYDPLCTHAWFLNSLRQTYPKVVAMEALSPMVLLW